MAVKPLLEANRLQCEPCSEMDMSISAWPSIFPRRPPVRVLAGFVDQPLLEKTRKTRREQDDHQRAADELAECELPTDSMP